MWGRFYYAIRQLEKEQLIAAVNRERVARGGVLTVYRVTPTGKVEFLRQLYAQFEEEAPASQTLYGPLLFLLYATSVFLKIWSAAGSRVSVISSRSWVRSERK